MMKKNLVAYILMGVYVIILIVGVVFNISILTNVGTALAVFSFLFIQQKQSKESYDEREKFIVERASALSFMALITVLVLGSMLNDFVGFLDYVTLEDMFQIIIGLGFMTFVSMYVYYSEKL
jgi:hypothetical protein